MEIFSGINYLAILVAVLSTMVVGSAYYSPFFMGKIWMKLANINSENMTGAVRGYLISTVGSIFSAFVLAVLFKLIGVSGSVNGMVYSLFICIGFVAPTLILTVAFEGKSFALYFLNLGNTLLSYGVMGAILGSWK